MGCIRSGVLNGLRGRDAVGDAVDESVEVSDGTGVGGGHAGYCIGRTCHPLPGDTAHGNMLRRGAVLVDEEPHVVCLNEKTRSGVPDSSRVREVNLRYINHANP